MRRCGADSCLRSDEPDCRESSSQCHGPDFDRTEEFLIAYYRTRRSTRASWSTRHDLATLLAGSGLFALGLIRDVDPTWSIVGFAMVAFRLVQHSRNSGQYEGAFEGIIEKYEAALEAAGQPEAGSLPETRAAGSPDSKPAG